jgi:hypothetical protein
VVVKNQSIIIFSRQPVLTLPAAPLSGISASLRQAAESALATAGQDAHPVNRLDVAHGIGTDTYPKEHQQKLRSGLEPDHSCP